MTAPALITEPGAYPGIDGDRYHGVEICDAPSISSSGLKLISAKSPRHFWAQSPMNPRRPARKEKRHFRVGHGVHDILMPGDHFKQRYHVTPQGYDARSKDWSDHRQAAEWAQRKGKAVISASEYEMIEVMGEQLVGNELAHALLTAGEPEMTLAARDPVTGVWVRGRPDILPTTMEIIPDIKTAADASLDAYERAATRFGYFQSAAHYLDVIEWLYGPAKRRFVLITVEKEYPYVVTIDQLDDVDIDFARYRNRDALNRFAACVKAGTEMRHWPAYNTPEKPIRQLQMTNYERAMINQAVERGELSYA